MKLTKTTLEAILQFLPDILDGSIYTDSSKLQSLHEHFYANKNNPTHKITFVQYLIQFLSFDQLNQLTDKMLAFIEFPLWESMGGLLFIELLVLNFDMQEIYNKFIANEYEEVLKLLNLPPFALAHIKTRILPAFEKVMTDKTNEQKNKKLQDIVFYLVFVMPFVRCLISKNKLNSYYWELTTNSKEGLLIRDFLNLFNPPEYLLSGSPKSKILQEQLSATKLRITQQITQATSTEIHTPISSSPAASESTELSRKRAILLTTHLLTLSTTFSTAQFGKCVNENVFRLLSIKEPSELESEIQKLSKAMKDAESAPAHIASASSTVVARPSTSYKPSAWESLARDHYKGSSYQSLSAKAPAAYSAASEANAVLAHGLFVSRPSSILESENHSKLADIQSTAREDVSCQSGLIQK